MHGDNAWLMVRKFKGELVNGHTSFQRSFFAFFKTDQYFQLS